MPPAVSAERIASGDRRFRTSGLGARDPAAPSWQVAQSRAKIAAPSVAGVWARLRRGDGGRATAPSRQRRARPSAAAERSFARRRQVLLVASPARATSRRPRRSSAAARPDPARRRASARRPRRSTTAGRDRLHHRAAAHLVRPVPSSSISSWPQVWLCQFDRLPFGNLRRVVRTLVASTAAGRAAHEVAGLTDDPDRARRRRTGSPGASIRDMRCLRSADVLRRLRVHLRHRHRDVVVGEDARRRWRPRAARRCPAP